MQTIAGFAAGRRRLGKDGETMSRLYAIEGRLSLTGSMADHRLRVPSSGIGGVATLLAGKLGAGGGGNNFAAFNDPRTEAWIAGMADDLARAKGRASSSAAASSRRCPLARRADQRRAGEFGRGCPGRSLLRRRFLHPEQPSPSDQPGRGQNPVHPRRKSGLQRPGRTRLRRSARAGRAGHPPRRSRRRDERGRHDPRPRAHFLEAWGDAVTRAGLYLSAQPLILPLYHGISELELLGQLAGLPAPKGAEYIQETFAQLAGGASSAHDAWRQFVHDGFAAITGRLPSFGETGDKARAASTTPFIPTAPLQSGQYELVFTLGAIDDGRHANNGWLQEMPDPVTKLTWDNALLMSPATATKLGRERRHGQRQRLRPARTPISRPAFPTRPSRLIRPRLSRWSG